MDQPTAAELILPSGMWDGIRQHLLSDLSREYACQLLCGALRIQDKVRLLAERLVVPEPQDYVRQVGAPLELRPEYDMALRQECANQNLHLVDLHSHPFTRTDVSFSWIDDVDEFTKVKWFAKNLPAMYYASVVLGTESVSGRMFISDAQGVVKTLNMSIRNLDVPSSIPI